MRGKLVLRFCFMLGLAVAAVSADAQQQPSRDDALTEREQVTAIDLVVELTKDGKSPLEPADGLTPEDFVVEEGGRELAVVGIDAPPSSEPWKLLIYFDQRLASPASIRWAASTLADLALTLAELGEVEVVVADPEPRLILAATRDSVIIDQMLSGLFLEDARGSEILALREEFLLERQDAEELSTARAVNALVAEELRLVGSYQDGLLATLVEQVPGTARRALLLVSDGFDLRLGEFYRQYAEIDEQAAAGLETMTREWAETVAAYGWTVISVQALERVRPRTSGAVPAQDDRTIGFRLPGITSRLEGSLDPQKAAAHHELGQRLAEQGQHEEAEASYKEALRFYHDHPKYAQQRASVLVDLGETLRRLERTGEARLAIREAVDLDENLAAAHPFTRARLEAPGEPLETLAALAGGRTVRSVDELSAAIVGLERRLRLTFQFQGAPDGENHQVSTRLRDGSLQVQSQSWVRFGTPPTVSALRARRLLAGELEVGDLEARCRFVQSSKSYSGRTGTLEIEVSDPSGEIAVVGRELRLTLGIAREEGPFVVRHESIVLGEEPYRMPLELADDEIFLSVVVDELASGRWGGATTEF